MKCYEKPQAELLCFTLSHAITEGDEGAEGGGGITPSNPFNRTYIDIK